MTIEGSAAAFGLILVTATPRFPGLAVISVVRPNVYDLAMHQDALPDVHAVSHDATRKGFRLKPLLLTADCSGSL